MKESSMSYQYNSSGSSRLRRFAPELHPEYFKVDARSLSDYLVFMERYAAYVCAHRTDVNANEGDQTWRSFFASDITVFLAKLKCLNREQFLPFYLHSDVADERQLATLQKKLNALFAFVMVINQSYWQVLGLRTEVPKVLHLLRYIEHIKFNDYLGDIWHLALSLGLYIPEDDLMPRDLEEIWGLIKMPKGNRQADHMDQLANAMNSFFTMAMEMVHYGSDMFEDSLNIQHHNPGMAMVIAFLSLYQHLQKDLNALTGRHLDYFYKTLLQQDFKPSEPDHAYVYFKLSDHVKEYTIARGTLFKAGLDKEGYDYLYEASDFLTVTKAKVTALATIYLPQIQEQGAGSSYKRVSGIYHSPLIQMVEGNLDFSVLQGSSSMATFGEDQFKLGSQTLQAAELGFAVASPVLLLSEGLRSISTVLTFQLKSLSVLFSYLERQAQHGQSGFERAFDKVFSNVFKLSLSTKEGWYEVESYSVLPPKPGSGSITFSFTLSKGAPSVVAIGDDWPHEEDKGVYNTQWPVLKICLSSERSMYPYTYLKDLRISDCVLSVDVRSVKNLELYNDLGKLDTSTPFYPFGTMPVVGSSFMVGHEELYKKNIDEFSLELSWHNLPKTYGGLKEYYQEYEELLEDDSFKVEVTALSDYEFYPQEKIQQYSLFAMQGDDGNVARLASKNVLQGFDVKALRINGNFAEVDIPPYDQKAKLGYLKLELVGPEMGFGHQKYSSLYAAKILKGLKNNKIGVLNAPYTPQLKSICLNYKATERLNFEGTSASSSNAKESAYLIQPYGLRTVFEEGSSSSQYFLPNYEHDGYLLIGVEDLVKGQDLSLYFVLDPQIGNDFEVDTPTVEWFYIYGDKWVPFEPRQIVFDTTEGFTTSGVVKISMPNGIDLENLVAPKGKFWIVAALKGDVNLAARVKSLYTQALKLTWVAHRPGAAWQYNLVPYSISSMLVARPEIAGIVQPMASFGGRPKELEIDFYARISERLQHRNRCVTTWDYERMVLDQFPAVSQVKCLSPISHPEYVAAGHVIVVVVPKTGNEATLYPKFNYSMLQEIKTFLEIHAAPTINIQVVNPVYEEVKVSASIMCSDENQQGIAIEQLHRDLQDLICPWYRDPEKEVILGGRVYVDDVEVFIANRSYISFVTRVSLLGLHYSNGDYKISDTVAPSLGKVLHASKPWVVLVPMKSHQLSLIAREAYIAPEKAAIENLRLGTEFVLAAPLEALNKPTDVDLDITGAFGYVSVQIDL